MPVDSVGLVLVAVPLAWAGVQWWRVRRFIARAVRTRGTIVELVELKTRQRRRYGRFYAPEVAFTAKDGSKVQFRGRSFPGRTRLRPGDDVDVLYEAGDPASTAQVADDSLWRPVARPGCVTLVLLVVLGASLVESTCR